MRTIILPTLLAASLSLEIAGASSSGARVHRIAHPVPAPSMVQPVPQQPRRHSILLSPTAAPVRPEPVSEQPLVLPKAKPVTQPAPVVESPAQEPSRMRVAPLAPREVVSPRPIPTTFPVAYRPVVRPLAPREEQPVLQASPRHIQPRSSSATIHRRLELHPVATTVPAPQPVQVAAIPGRVETRKAPMIHRVSAPVAEKAITVPPPAPKRIVVAEPPSARPVLVRKPEPVTNRGSHPVVFSTPSQTSVTERAVPRRVVTPTVVKNGAPASLAPQPIPSNRPRRRLPIAPVSDSGALPSVPAS